MHLHRPGRPALRRDPARPRCPGAGTDHPQRHLRGPAPLARTGRTRHPRRAGRGPGPGLSRHGRAAQLHLRALPARRQRAGRRTDRLGRVQRGALRQQRARRTHQQVRRLHGYLLRPHRSRAAGRLPPRRAAPGAGTDRSGRPRQRRRCLLPDPRLPLRPALRRTDPGDRRPAAAAAGPRRAQGLRRGAGHQFLGADVPRHRRHPGSP
ncbi:LigA [Pseudomonas aeruginosa 18A]|nr:LigA [Pseudomonas aeruginosa 18A]